jgi:hypothetical protein
MTELDALSMHGSFAGSQHLGLGLGHGTGDRVGIERVGYDRPGPRARSIAVTARIAALSRHT